MPTLDLYLPRQSAAAQATTVTPLLRATGPVGSALMTSMRGAELLVCVAAGQGGVPAGTMLRGDLVPLIGGRLAGLIAPPLATSVHPQEGE